MILCNVLLYRTPPYVLRHITHFLLNIIDGDDDEYAVSLARITFVLCNLIRRLSSLFESKSSDPSDVKTRALQALGLQRGLAGKNSLRRNSS